MVRLSIGALSNVLGQERGEQMNSNNQNSQEERDRDHQDQPCWFLA
jgi:hypothetical protein